MIFLGLKDGNKFSHIFLFKLNLFIRQQALQYSIVCSYKIQIGDGSPNRLCEFATLDDQMEYGARAVRARIPSLHIQRSVFVLMSFVNHKL